MVTENVGLNLHLLNATESMQTTYRQSAINNNWLET